jgi:hypothetical protein
MYAITMLMVNTTKLDIKKDHDVEIESILSNPAVLDREASGF